jgi:hypothetical protein
MRESIHVPLLSLMTLHAPDSLVSVGAELPVVDDSRRRFPVTLDTAPGRCRYGNVSFDEADFFTLASNLHRLYEYERREKEKAEKADEIAFGL